MPDIHQGVVVARHAVLVGLAQNIQAVGSKDCDSAVHAAALLLADAQHVSRLEDITGKRGRGQRITERIRSRAGPGQLNDSLLLRNPRDLLAVGGDVVRPVAGLVDLGEGLGGEEG